MSVYKSISIVILIILIAASLLFSACNEDEETADQSFTAASFDVACEPAAFASGIIVRTQEEYDALSFPAECTPPSFDFSSNTLIGIRTSVSGCELDYDRSIERSPSTLTYSIRLNATGACEKLNTSNNWISVPRVGPNTEVVFDVQ